MGFDLIFEIFPILFMIVFGIVLAVFVVSAVRGSPNGTKTTTVPA